MENVIGNNAVTMGIYVHTTANKSSTTGAYRHDTTVLYTYEKLQLWPRKMEHKRIYFAGYYSFPSATDSFWRRQKKLPLPDDLEK